MARRPTQIGHAGAPLRLVPLSPDPGEGGEDERTTVEQPPDNPPVAAGSTPGAPAAHKASPAAKPGTAPAGTPIDEHWDDGTTIDEATMAGSAPQTDDAVEEMVTVDERRVAPARLIVIAGNDTGREFTLHAGKVLTVGRAMDNDVVLTDIAVSRKHLDVLWDGGAWVLKDRGSGNGTLVNERIEDGSCQLRHGDRIEIGHTVFRFDHAASAGPGAPIGWEQNDEEASTVAGRSQPKMTMKGPPPAAAPASLGTPRRSAPTTSPPPAPGDRARATLPPPRPRPPSSGGALSSRLALPPNPGAAAEDAQRAAAAEPALLIAPSIDRPDRSMTHTAHVDPLPFAAASGSMPPVHAYPQYAPPLPRKKLVGVLAGVLVAATMIGAIAAMTTDDAPPASAAGPAPAPDEAAMAVALPVAVDAAAVAPPEPEPEPEPEPVKIEVDPVPPPPEPEPEPEPVPVEPAPPTPAPVTPAPAPTPPPKKITPPPPKKVTPPPKKVTPPPRKAPPKAVATASGAKKKAESLYASKDFKAAAAAARAGADSGDATEVAELRRMAKDLDALAAAWTAGNASASTRATDALTSFKKALAADKRLGGTHAPMIREKLAQVAPKAAAGFMAKGNYEAAKQAADTAVNFGAGSSPTVANVRQSLERKAGEFFATAQKLMASKPEDAKSLLRRVQKIVPPDSPWYAKAYKALNQRKASRDDDE